ncbi:MAG TPA: hypothetical protein VK752_10345 [Bryobacteraceae bacterium]|jgi:hypothetical protein|nr:hypothetical protein [Bryobacteraceae bacterium]
MMIFCGRPLRASYVLPMLLMAARGFAQDAAVAQQQSAPPATDAATVPTKPVALPADSDAQKPPQTKAEHAQADQEAPPDKRVLGVLPNYRTVNETGTYEPITTKQKLIIACKDSFDYPLILLSAAFAGISQLDNSDQSYHQGVEGYAKRLAANYADQAIGNMMTEGFFPAMLHEDPRYRRIGPSRGTKKYRTWYAFSRVFVTRTDSGGTRFNYSEWLGNATGVAISNAYHPDERDALDNVEKLLEQVATDGISQILKEFWPDIKHKFFHKNTPTSD